MANDLYVRAKVDGSSEDHFYWDWDTVVISFLKRVAKFNHFERLSLSVSCWIEDDQSSVDYQTKRIASVARALIGAIRSNPKLTCLDLSDPESFVDWGPHLKIIMKAMKKHRSLGLFKVNKYPRQKDPDNASAAAFAITQP